MFQNKSFKFQYQCLSSGLDCLIFNIKSQIIRKHDLCIFQAFYISDKKFATKINKYIIFPKNNSMNFHKHV
jgi:hypothetical protein